MVNRGWSSDYLDRMNESEFLATLEGQIQYDEDVAEAERIAAERAAQRSNR